MKGVCGLYLERRKKYTVSDAHPVRTQGNGKKRSKHSPLLSKEGKNKRKGGAEKT